MDRRFRLLAPAFMLLTCIVFTPAVAVAGDAQPLVEPAHISMAELRAIREARLTEDERRRGERARELLLVAAASMKRINAQVIAEMAGAFDAQATEEAEGFVDISLLGDISGKHATPVAWAAAHEAMRRYEQEGVLAQVRQAAEAPALVMPKHEAQRLVDDYTEITALLEGVGAVRSASVALAISARLNNWRGNGCGVQEDLRAVFRLGGALGAPGSIAAISMLVGNSVTALGAATVQDLMQQGDLTSTKAGMLQRVMEETLFTPDRKLISENQTLEWLSACEQMLAETPEPLRPVLRKQAEAIAASMRELSTLAAAATPQERASGRFDSAAICKKHWLLLSPLNSFCELFVDTNKIYRTIDQLECESAGIRIMVALERYRMARGELPASLADLAPEFMADLPGDPYSADGSFRYRRQPAQGIWPESYVLYSDGLDGIDDGGAYPSDAKYDVRYNATSGRCTNCDFPINE